ncbi:hypothetical protein GQ53DRAFT_845457 [Thozetella sp. PMI_491]|nr:hypothetical protein GQ53DRAFT_845457 [Thozetella sp. PMI_491]
MCTGFNYSPRYFVETDRYQGSSVQFSEDGSAMTIDGIKLGAPVVLTRRTDLDERTEAVYTDPRVPFDRLEARGFVDGILSPAADLQGRPLEDIITNWITAWESSVDRYFQDSEVPQIRAAFIRWIGGTGPDVLQLDERLIAGETFSDRGRAVWRRLKTKTFIKNWIVTRDGRGWIALFNGEPLPEDQIVVVRGLPEYPAVLREVQGGGAFKLIGLLIERVPLASGPWQKTSKGFLGSADYPWEKVTLV